MKTKSKSLFLTTIISLAMVFSMMFGIMPNNLKSVYASSTQKSIGFAIKEPFDVYFAETGNNKVQNTSTGVDGKLTHLPELYRTDTVVYVAKLESCASKYGLNAITVKDSFRLIQQDWKTGET